MYKEEVKEKLALKEENLLIEQKSPEDGNFILFSVKISVLNNVSLGINSTIQYLIP